MYRRSSSAFTRLIEWVYRSRFQICYRGQYFRTQQLHFIASTPSTPSTPSPIQNITQSHYNSHLSRRYSTTDSTLLINQYNLITKMAFPSTKTAALAFISSWVLLISASPCASAPAPYASSNTTTTTPQAAVAYPEPITIGQLSIPHGHMIDCRKYNLETDNDARDAGTPTKTTMLDVCAQGPSNTVTMIQSIQTGFPSNPLCNWRFDLDGYTGLELLCVSGTEKDAEPQVTAIATGGVQTHNCTALPLTVFPTSCGVGAAISQRYACQ
ncbi:hypothetical protein B0T22DRAFT_461378 [Podospora appendiculata]|uniref:Uncharacterized protein n=1 Tax=Podospora appendiculata TaxID=314037 RepID=A0AAE0XB16_9PEZI|nr:hypothetical protein B0T22DRAFT_461378 [Podospora appendiculata]